VTTLAEAFEAECRRKIGHTAALAMPQREPTWNDWLALFPNTTEGRIAARHAVGFDTPAHLRPGTKKYTQQRSFMRRLQKRGAGPDRKQRRGAPTKLSTQEAGVVRAQWRRNARPHTVRKVLELLNRYGATVYDLELEFAYDGDGRMRNLSHYAVGISSTVLRRSGFLMPMIKQQPIPWENLSRSFLLAYGRAYGMGDFGVAGSDDVEALSFRIGFTDRAQYTFGVKSRPAGAKRATGNKYRGLRAS
jgi:hypothetical protein